ncbi:hypothetical protein [Alkanindiges illinoisensis]|uniref:hypothetical protein n=1 Tax=Alkanindiges illinoisensis TaxID=197183 RepID=UPI00047D03C0|nr:hypothetical protein [Alkanindiges illinoisensis]
MNIIANQNQLDHLCAALIDSVTPSPVMPPEGVRYVCNNLLAIHQLTLRIARSTKYPFTWPPLKSLRPVQDFQPRISPLGSDFMNLVRQLNPDHLYRLFPRHQFHPLIHLFIDKMNQYQLWGRPLDHLMNMGVVINRCFDDISKTAFKKEFEKQCEQWLDPLQTRHCDFTNHTEKLLKAQSQYLVSRLELGYGNSHDQQGIHATLMQQHWQQLVDRLTQELSPDGLLAAFWLPDWIAGYGYRYSLMLITSPMLNPDSLVASRDRVMTYWTNIARPYGTGIIQGAYPLPYRHAGCGLVERGDKHKKQQVELARTYMTKAHYLVRPAIAGGFGFISVLDTDTNPR